MVRQLFEARCLDSAFWHRFAATAHAPTGLHPERYGIELVEMPKATFAKNDLEFRDPTGCDHDQLSGGLTKAVFNYMHGIGIEDDVRKWFEHPVPKPSVNKSFIKKSLAAKDDRREPRLKVLR
jgi:hypothetical protein